MILDTLLFPHYRGKLLLRTRKTGALVQNRGNNSRDLTVTVSRSRESIESSDASLDPICRTILAEESADSKYYESRSLRDVGIKSRLDSSPNKPRTMGVLSRPKASTSLSTQSTGYRIVVSNLQANVTQEDIKVEHDGESFTRLRLYGVSRY